MRRHQDDILQLQQGKLFPTRGGKIKKVNSLQNKINQYSLIIIWIEGSNYPDRCLKFVVRLHLRRRSLVCLTPVG